jgi:hypothetical protein
LNTLVATGVSFFSLQRNYQKSDSVGDDKPPKWQHPAKKYSDFGGSFQEWTQKVHLGVLYYAQFKRRYAQCKPQK